DMARYAKSSMPGPIALGWNRLLHDRGRASQLVIGRRPHTLDHHIAVPEQFGGLLAGAPAATNEAFLTFVFQELEKSANLRRAHVANVFEPQDPHGFGGQRHIEKADRGLVNKRKLSLRSWIEQHSPALALIAVGIENPCVITERIEIVHGRQ